MTDDEIDLDELSRLARSAIRVPDPKANPTVRLMTAAMAQAARDKLANAMTPDVVLFLIDRLRSREGA